MSTESKEFKQQKAWQMPDTYIIIFFVVVLAALLTYVVPVGSFNIDYKIVNENNEVIHVGEEGNFEVGGKVFKLEETTVYNAQGEELGQIEDKKSFTYDENGVYFRGVKEYGDYVQAKDDQGKPLKKGIKIFEKWGGVGFFNYAFEGLVSGSKWGSAVGVVAFILIIGGAFGIVLQTGAVEESILSLIKKTKGAEIIVIPILFLAFSAGGAVFGMGEEAIAFSLITIPLVIGLGYDSITGIMVTYVATQIGFGASWMNPFSVVIAQGIAGVSGGILFRIVMWVFFTAVGIVYTVMHARKVKKDPKKSIAYESDAYFREDMKNVEEIHTKFGTGHILVLLSILLSVVWIIWGVAKHAYYLPEIAAVFFIMGIVAGVIGVIFKLNDMRVNDIAESFRGGARDLVGAAMVVGMAKGIMLVLGGSSATDATVLNTILNGMGQAIGGLPAAVSAWIMFVFQSVFNFFVVSGSGQAALTMPLMAPLADFVGVTRQVAVLAFQLGDGFTNIIVPTSASLMGVLGVARLDWGKWAKFQIKFQAVLFGLASLIVIFATVIGFS